MKKAAYFFVCAVLCITFGFHSSLLAQTTSVYGLPPNITALPIPLGFVNVLTGHLRLEWPFMTVPERNDKQVFTFGHESGYCTFYNNQWICRSGPGSVWGSQKGFNIQYDAVKESCPDPQYPFGNATRYQNFRLHDAVGTEYTTNQELYTYQITCFDSSGHADPNKGTPSNTGGEDQVGMGFSFTATNLDNGGIATTLHDAEGNASTANGLAITLDPNGNTIGSYFDLNRNAYYDTFGRKMYPAPSDPYAFPIAITGTSCPGTRYYYVRSADGTQATTAETTANFQLSNNPATVCLRTALTLADGSEYTFTYDVGTSGSHTGQLTGYTLPTGGQVTIGYSTTGNSTGYVNSIAYDGATWNLSYNVVINGQNSQTTTTVTGPSRYDATTHSYVNDKTVYTSVLGGDPYVQTIQYYSGPSTLVKTVNVTYTGPSTALVGTVTTTLNDTGQTSKVQYTYGIQTRYGSGLRNYPTEIQEWDFGAVSPTRTKTISYTSGYHIQPTSIKVYAGDVNGTLIASTTYAYDEYTSNFCTVPTLSAFTGAPGHDDVNYGTSFTNRGNPTTISRWISGSTWAVSHRCYDTLGNVTQEVDPGGHHTSYSYSENWSDTTCISSGTQTHGMRTAVTDELGHITSTKYSSCPNTVSSATDQNGHTTSFTYDDMVRLVRTVSPPDVHGAQPETDISYPDAVSIERTTKIDSTHSTDYWELHDSYGRLSRTATFNDQTGANIWDQVDTCYDALGRKSFVSYPYQNTGFGATKACSSSVEPGDAYTYDTLGRVRTATHSDGSVLTTNYAGSATQVIDEGNGSLNEQRITQTDSFGRLVSVCEVSSGTLLGNGGTPASCGLKIAGTGFLTTYTYDVLDNLKTVTQGVITRTFNYDGLSELTSANNAESGTTSYTYNTDGLVSTRTRPMANQSANATTTTTYTYDGVHRLKTKTYSDSSGKNATYNYDESTAWGKTISNPVGHLTSESNVANTRSVYSYDALGRILSNWQCGPSTCGSSFYQLQYDYDLASDMISSTNGQLVTFTYNYNENRKLRSMTSSFADANHPATLLSNATYGDAGRIFATFGNGLTEERFYSPRGQLQNKWLGTLSNGSLTNLVYTFGLDLAPDGNVIRGNDSVNGNWAYSYDQFNRLYASANINGTQYSYAYDRYGNRWQQNGPLSFLVTFNGNNNRIDGYTYDSAGNLTYIPASNANPSPHTLTYDAENHIVSVDGGSTASYVYDAEGRRIRITLPGQSQWYNVECLYDLEGHCITKNNYSTLEWASGEIYAGGEHIASYNSGTTFFNATDWIGTERYRTYPNGSVAETCLSLPFGDGESCASDLAISPLHLTGKEHDPETGLDYFGARFHSETAGRFVSPDWSAKAEPVPYAKLGDPQSLNLYAFVGNNPIGRFDLDGHGDPQKEDTPAARDARLCAVFHTHCTGEVLDWYYRFQNSLQQRQQALNAAAGRAGDRYGRFRRELADWWDGKKCDWMIVNCLNVVAADPFTNPSGAPAMVRVGRWMSPEELEKMKDNGRVVESRLNGVTSVTVPPDPTAYRDAPKGSVFVEFDVEASAVKGMTANGWGKIYGPSSLFAEKYGVKEMPEAINIDVLEDIP